MKQLYDLRMSSGTGQARTHLLPELYVDNFDNEQVFQQLEMFNSHILEEHRKAIKAVRTRSCGTAGKVKSSKPDKALSKDVTDDSRSVNKQVRFESRNSSYLDEDADNEEDIETGSDVDSEEDSALQKLLESLNDGKRTTLQNDDVDDDIEDNDEASDDDDDDDNEDNEPELNSDDTDSDSDVDNDTTASSRRRTVLKRKNKNRVSSVDDQFFKLAEMEAFLDEQDLKEQRQHSGDADESEDDDDYELSTDDKVVFF